MENRSLMSIPPGKFHFRMTKVWITTVKLCFTTNWINSNTIYLFVSHWNGRWKVFLQDGLIFWLTLVWWKPNKLMKSHEFWFQFISRFCLAPSKSYQFNFLLVDIPQPPLTTGHHFHILIPGWDLCPHCMCTQRRCQGRRELTSREQGWCQWVQQVGHPHIWALLVWKKI